MPLAIANKAATTTRTNRSTFIFYAPELLFPIRCPIRYAAKAAPRAGIIVTGVSISKAEINTIAMAIIAETVPILIDKKPAKGRGFLSHRPIIAAGRIAEAQIV
jgi:hypothetical protein